MKTTPKEQKCYGDFDSWGWRGTGGGCQIRCMVDYEKEREAFMPFLCQDNFAMTVRS